MYVIKFTGPTRGFFSIFIEVVRCIDFAVTNHLPYYVDLSESNSLYTDTAAMQGDKNVWNYYYIQPNKLPATGKIQYSAPAYEGDATRIWRPSHFKKVYTNVVSKLVFTPVVQATLNGIKAKIPVNTLGVHIRKTDHYQEVPPVPLEYYIELVRKKTTADKLQNVFIATDDASVLTLFINEFTGINIIYNNVIRSTTGAPVHKFDNEKNGFKLGLDALEDVYGLSLCREVILSNSNFSYCVLYFNPFIKYQLLDGFVYHEQKQSAALNYAANKRLNRRYIFFNNARIVNIYRKWKHFKKIFTSKKRAAI